MSYGSISGKARVSSARPQAFAICDRCGFQYNHVDLVWQHDWRGNTMQRLNILVCRTCLDIPQEQLRTIVLSPDPIPVRDPRPEQYGNNNNFRTISGEDTVDPVTQIPRPGKSRRLTESNDFRVSQLIGTSGGKESPPGLNIDASMPFVNDQALNVPINFTSITPDGSSVITVVTPLAHGLADNDQIIITGAALSSADGFYSVLVVNDNTFTVNSNRAIIIGTAITTVNTKILKTIVGIPRGTETIPQTGI